METSNSSNVLALACLVLCAACSSPKGDSTESETGGRSNGGATGSHLGGSGSNLGGSSASSGGSFSSGGSSASFGGSLSSSGKTGSGGSLSSSGGAGAGGRVAGGSSGGSAGRAGHAEGGAGRGGSSSSGNAGAGGTGGATSTSCLKPVFTTSDHNGGFSDGAYYVHNNMWNSDATLGPETLYACSYRNWYVVSNQTNEAGAVKTYPNVHKDYDDVPIASFKKLTTTFAESSPHVGIYNVAYDIWTNGVATSGSTELMIWTENFNQVPAGSKAAKATFGEHTYDVWRTSNGRYLAFVPEQPFTSGTLDLLEIFQWTTSQGWLRSDSTVGQIGFGVEIVATDGHDAVFQFTDFEIVDQ